MYSEKSVVSICPDAERIHNAIGKSYADPSLRISAGAILITIRLPGHLKSFVLRAASMRC